MKKLSVKKRDNKGFSLVELIVVILIMAVIAVALAPQVMKWVGRSKVSTDRNNIGQIESAVNAGVADYMAKTSTAELEADVTCYISTDGKGLTTEINAAYVAAKEPTDAVIASVKEAMNGKYPTTQSKADTVFKISITKKGSVTVTVVDKNGDLVELDKME